MEKLFALVDCNNFFASCERLFRPDLKNTPIVVLSNNDGCVIARSEEAKQLGINMCDPYFKIKNNAKSLGIIPFSANFPLYSDISRRVMDTLSELCENIEIYSIDEAFLDYSTYPFQSNHPQFLPTPKTLGLHIRETIRQWVGIPVSIGLAPTKTLAKIAAHIAKKHPASQGVYDLTCPEQRAKTLPSIPIHDIWGIGRKTIPVLQKQGIHTAAALASMPLDSARKRGGIHLERIVLELNGTSCRTHRSSDEPQHQIMYSRTFGHPITQYSDIRQAISNFSEEISATLREQQQITSGISVFISTGSFKEKEHTYSNSSTLPLFPPTDDPRTIRHLAIQIVESLWKHGFAYKRAGIILNDLSPVTCQQTILPLPTPSHNTNTPAPLSPKLIKALDALNKNKKRIWYAAEGITHNPNTPDPHWKIIRKNLSPAYTTSWTQLPTIN